MKVRVYRILGVSTSAVSFVDLRIVFAWQDCYRAGEDLKAGCSTAPTNMPLNYPRTWLLLARMGLGAKDTLWGAALLETAFFVGLLLMIWGRDLKEIWPLLVLLPSAPIWLALERCNVDQVVFPALVGLAFVNEIGAFAVIFVAITLKLYPIGAAAAFLSERTRIALCWLSATAAALALFLMTPMADMRGVLTRRPVSYGWSFGWRVLPGIIDAHLSTRGIHVFPALCIASFLAMVLVVIFGGLTVVKINYTKPEWSQRERRWLQASLGTFIACFVIGHNYDYRLVLLLPALPAICVAIVQKGWRSMEGLFAVAAILVFWLERDQHTIIVLSKELAGWALFGLSVPLLLRSHEFRLSENLHYFHQGVVRRVKVSQGV